MANMAKEDRAGGSADPVADWGWWCAHGPLSIEELASVPEWTIAGTAIAEELGAGYSDHDVKDVTVDVMIKLATSHAETAANFRRQRTKEIRRLHRLSSKKTERLNQLEVLRLAMSRQGSDGYDNFGLIVVAARRKAIDYKRKVGRTSPQRCMEDFAAAVDESGYSRIEDAAALLDRLNALPDDAFDLVKDVVDLLNKYPDPPAGFRNDYLQSKWGLHSHRSVIRRLKKLHGLIWGPDRRV